MISLIRLIAPTHLLLFFIACSSISLGGCSREAERPRSTEPMTMCTEGNEGCPCKEDGTCNTLGGVEMVCQEDQCVMPSDDPQPVDPSMPVITGFKVEPDQARGCEVVILDPDNVLKDVQFNSSVKGHWMRRGSRVAVAFFAQENQAIPQGAVSFESTRATLDLEMVNLKCVDLVGTPLSNASLSFD